MYTRTDVAKHFQTTAETIRRWSRDFARYLSPSANSSTKSEYTDDDMDVLTFIHDAYQNNDKTDDIALMLASGQRGTWSGVLQNRSIEVTENQFEQIVKIRQERDDLQTALTDARTQIAVLQQQVKDTQALRDEIRQLNREIGKLEARIEMMQEDD